MLKVDEAKEFINMWLINTLTLQMKKAPNVCKNCFKW